MKKTSVRVLNLYSGLGGNRKNWTGVEVISVELNPKIAAVYKRLFPSDVIVVGDARQYLVEHYKEFDFIWSSPPCQSHTRMVKASRNNPKGIPDMGLYGEIVFLQSFFSGKWVVENVAPYYNPLISPSKKIGRHLFWSNFPIIAVDVPSPQNFIKQSTLAGKKVLMDWLGIHYRENIYYNGNHCPVQILRNCVHPVIGEQIFKSAYEPAQEQAGVS